jgi:hypothetical protein
MTGSAMDLTILHQRPDALNPSRLQAALSRRRELTAQAYRREPARRWARRRPLPALQRLYRPQPVERALQNEDRGVLVDYGLALAAADISGDQLALHGGGGQPLVP